VEESSTYSVCFAATDGKTARVVTFLEVHSLRIVDQFVKFEGADGEIIGIVILRNGDFVRRGMTPKEIRNP
jgi:hypothetical protein